MQVVLTYRWRMGRYKSISHTHLLEPPYVPFVWHFIHGFPLKGFFPQMSRDSEKHITFKLLNLLHCMIYYTQEILNIAERGPLHAEWEFMKCPYSCCLLSPPALMTWFYLKNYYHTRYCSKMVPCLYWFGLWHHSFPMRHFINFVHNPPPREWHWFYISWCTSYNSNYVQLSKLYLASFPNLRAPVLLNITQEKSETGG